MSDETTPAPLSDADIAEIVERNRSLTAYLTELVQPPRRLFDTRLFTGADLANGDIHALLDTLAAYREIVAAVAGYDATYCGIEIGHECALNAQQRARTGGQDFGCHWNKFEDDRTRHMFVHGENCPVTRARALLADTQTPGQESE